MAVHALRGLIVALTVLAFTAPAHAAVSVLDNGKVHVALDLSQGGRIDWLSAAGGAHADNLVFDAEQSYYFPALHSDEMQAQVVASRSDGRTAYVRAVDQTCSCTLETWTTLQGNAVTVRNRLVAFRGDATNEPQWQELPALYTMGEAYRLVSYTGGEPFTHAPARDLTGLAHFPFFQPTQHLDVTATEHWAAFVDAHGYGVGLFEPDLVHFTAIAGDEGGYPSGYLAGGRAEQLDQNVVYTYAYTLILGSVAQIRAYAYAHRTDTRPNYVFARDRQHFVEQNASDNGFPIDGALRFNVNQPNAELVGPEQQWPARRTPYLYVRGAWHTNPSQAELTWTNTYGLGGKTVFNVYPDGYFHTYRIKPRWTGTVTGLQLYPSGGVAGPGAWVDLTCISWKPCPVDRRAESALYADAKGLVPFLDRFDTFDKNVWSVTGNSIAATAAVGDGGLVVSIPASAVPLAGQDSVNAGVWSRCTLDGNFDTQVDYRLLAWPAANQVNVNFSVAGVTLVRHNDSGVDQESAWFPPFGGGWANDLRPAGAFRFVRTGSLLEAYYRDWTGVWIELGNGRVATGPLGFGLGLWTNRTATGAHDVRVAFDDFRVTRGSLSCP